MNDTEIKLTAKDFSSGLDVKWCPGCGDYSILAQVQKTFAELIEVKKENIVWVSGIGCSSRFPYYMGTYGFHGIHGRAPVLATGVKVANPNLSVWVATGDGDLMAIGGNHFIHACRRNNDIKIVMFNNKIYGLTKGQYSPTSEKGKVTKSSPYGTPDYAFNPISLALGSGATLVARSLDRDIKHLQLMLKKLAEHKGLAFLEVYQNCVIFNDGAFDHLVDKETKDDNVLVLEDKKPLIFGKNKNKGIILDGLNPKIVDLSEGKYSINDVWVHDENDPNPTRAFLLSTFTDREGFPTPIGIFRRELKPTFVEEVYNQINEIKSKKGTGDLRKTLFSGNIWKVE